MRNLPIPLDWSISNSFLMLSSRADSVCFCVSIRSSSSCKLHSIKNFKKHTQSMVTKGNEYMAYAMKSHSWIICNRSQQCAYAFSMEISTKHPTKLRSGSYKTFTIFLRFFCLSRTKIDYFPITIKFDKFSYGTIFFILLAFLFSRSSLFLLITNIRHGS